MLVVVYVDMPTSCSIVGVQPKASFYPLLEFLALPVVMTIGREVVLNLFYSFLVVSLVVSESGAG